jgi:hypothetical protein
VHRNRIARAAVLAVISVVISVVIPLTIAIVVAVAPVRSIGDRRQALVVVAHLLRELAQLLPVRDVETETTPTRSV